MVVVEKVAKTSSRFPTFWGSLWSPPQPVGCEYGHSSCDARSWWRLRQTISCRRQEGGSSGCGESGCTNRCRHRWIANGWLRIVRQGAAEGLQRRSRVDRRTTNTWVTRSIPRTRGTPCTPARRVRTRGRGTESGRGLSTNSRRCGHPGRKPNDFSGGPDPIVTQGEIQ